MTYQIEKTIVRGISELSDGDIKTSLLSEMVSGKCFQCIAPQHSKSGKGEMIIWLEHA
jgi:hypothetical protein